MAKLNPEILEWAVRRSGLSDERITKMFPKYPQWLDGTWNPTVKQLRDFAHKTHVSVSDLFSETLPDYALQIADFRTQDDLPASAPSPELFDTVDAMLARQEWMRGYFLHEGYPAIDFVGAYKEQLLSGPTAISLARDMHALLHLDDDWARTCANEAEALRTLKDAIETAGISVVINGVVGDNTSRALEVSEFRGFALADDRAPLIFVNGRDAKSAQLFTLIHELTHLAFAQTGVSNASEDEDGSLEMERFCNAVAVEFLVPANVLLPWWRSHPSMSSYKRVDAVAHFSKASFVVVARKARDEGLIGEDEFFRLYEQHKNDASPVQRSSKGGGNYYFNERYKLGLVFSDAVIAAVHSDYLSYRDAYDLTGMSASSFQKYLEEVA